MAFGTGASVAQTASLDEVVKLSEARRGYEVEDGDNVTHLTVDISRGNERVIEVPRCSAGSVPRNLGFP
jgi:hypothetical protein